ncbi:unnamed protein product [Acanthocheilonema viteae]|uniref:Uncharacterized protein n=1 Tax=Acanthocheilonema viteae TaxID=6277 RepID=A0A498SQA7_ACAVI|nr:unnamed protein product [Acanthocheilonema viteae]
MQQMIFFFQFEKENNEDRTVDYWSAGTVAGSKEHLGTVKKASPSRKQGCCSNTQLAAAAVATVISPLSSSIITARYVVIEQRSQQYIKHEQYQYRPQFLQHYIKPPGNDLDKSITVDEVRKMKVKCNMT